MSHYPVLQKYIGGIIQEVNLISTRRREELKVLADYVQGSVKPAQLNFICTHNSRRSHISQIWAATAADFFDVDVEAFSGGTEATAFNPRAVDAMTRAGFIIEDTGGPNPVYLVRFSEDHPPIECFSKIYNDPTNPVENFAAVMTCSNADANCPFIPEATRISLTYKDPKEADDTPQEAARYDERVRQIGRELFYAMSLVGQLTS